MFDRILGQMKAGLKSFVGRTGEGRRRTGPIGQSMSFERLEPRMLLSGFTAYNDLVAGPQTHVNTTLYADNGGDSSGQLKDIATGAYTSALLSTFGVLDHFGGTGTNPAAGTDAGDIFAGFVDFSYGSNSVELSPGESYTYLFSDLDQGNTYEFVGTAVRGNDDYTNRWTLVTLIGADSLTPAHSTGLGIVTDGLAPNEVAIWTGANLDPGTEVDAGEDFHVPIVINGGVGQRVTGRNVRDWVGLTPLWWCFAKTSGGRVGKTLTAVGDRVESGLALLAAGLPGRPVLPPGQLGKGGQTL